jgi:hypothetical protein
MGDVQSFDPVNGQNIGNIPHMLRWWADAIERGEKEAETVLLVQIHAGPMQAPELFSFGRNALPVEVAGSLQYCASLALTLLNRGGQG